MPAKGVADVVFCLDSSTSMEPCFEAVRKHVVDFGAGLSSDAQTQWDVRFEFVSHATSRAGQNIQFRLRSMHEPSLWSSLYAANGGGGRYFTTDLNEFRAAISDLVAKGDETNFVALDFCLDLPWRTAPDCHRIVVVLTDEPLETGLYIEEQRAKIPELTEKIHRLGVKLFLIGPESAAYDELAMANGSEYEVVSGGAGLASADFGRLLRQIGKSVSASRAQAVRTGVQRALFGQDRWTPGEHQSFEGA